MAHEPPPPVIDSARVLSYAFVDDIPYRKWGALYVDGKLLEQVPCLAVCTNLGKDIGPLLFHCDAEGNVLGTFTASTVSAPDITLAAWRAQARQAFRETEIDVTSDTPRISLRPSNAPASSRGSHSSSIRKMSS
jgi:hypothetical protein